MEYPNSKWTLLSCAMASAGGIGSTSPATLGNGLMVTKPDPPAAGR